MERHIRSWLYAGKCINQFNQFRTPRWLNWWLSKQTTRWLIEIDSIQSTLIQLTLKCGTYLLGYVPFGVKLFRILWNNYTYNYKYWVSILSYLILSCPNLSYLLVHIMHIGTNGYLNALSSFLGNQSTRINVDRSAVDWLMTKKPLVELIEMVRASINVDSNQRPVDWCTSLSKTY